MAHSYTTPDGHEITVYSACYVDWGLQICNPEGESIFDCPCYIENSSCGWNVPADFEGEWDEYEGEMEEWTEEEWQAYLKDEADSLMEGALPWDYEYTPTDWRAIDDAAEERLLADIAADSEETVTSC